MGRISRQRLAVGLSTLLDAIAVALFFVQSAVGDADWIKDEFTAYEFSASVSDLGVRITVPVGITTCPESVVFVFALVADPISRLHRS